MKRPKNRNELQEVIDWLDANGTPLTEEEAQALIDKNKAKNSIKNDRERIKKTYNELHKILN